MSLKSFHEEIITILQITGSLCVKVWNHVGTITAVGMNYSFNLHLKKLSSLTHLFWEELKFEHLRLYLFKIPNQKKPTFRSKSFVCVFKSLQVYYTCILVQAGIIKWLMIIKTNRYKEQHLQKVISSTSNSTLQSTGEHLYKMYKNCIPCCIWHNFPLCFSNLNQKIKHFIQEIFYNWEPRADFFKNSCFRWGFTEFSVSRLQTEDILFLLVL